MPSCDGSRNERKQMTKKARRPVPSPSQFVEAQQVFLCGGLTTKFHQLWITSISLACPANPLAPGFRIPFCSPAQNSALLQLAPPLLRSHCCVAGTSRDEHRDGATAIQATHVRSVAAVLPLA